MLSFKLPCDTVDTIGSGNCTIVLPSSVFGNDGYCFNSSYMNLELALRITLWKGRSVSVSFNKASLKNESLKKERRVVSG